MVDARLPPYPLGEKNRIPEGFNHSSSIPSPNEYYEGEPQLSLQIKKEAPSFASKDPQSADYEYLERRLREFGSQKAPTPPIPIPIPTPSIPTHISSPTHGNTSNNVHNSNRGGDNDLISLARAVESNSGCKLAKCVVCDRGLPESFHMQKPVSWLSVCKLAMWALTQDGAAYGRKWFSLGRDICPFVEVHKYVCGREFTPNWKTTIGITMSTYAKRANMFIAGNPNELGLGYYMLPEDATDPYLETTPLIIGRHYRTPNPHNQQSSSRSNTPPVSTILSPPSPPHSTSGPLSAPSTPPHGSSSHHVRPGTPPRRPTSPVHHSSSSSRQRASTPPPRSITPPPQRALTPPPIHTIHISNNSPFPSPRAQSPRDGPSGLGPLASVAQIQASPMSSANGSPNSDMSSEVAAYMNDPACLMGVIRMRRKRLNGEMQRRAIGERKHTTDTERQLLLDYYDKFGTCTTVPEFTELQHRLGWDSHRTKIWLYNRKTYHHLDRPGDKRKKPRTNPSSPTHGSEGNYDSDEEMYYAEEVEGANNEYNDRENKSEVALDEEQHEYVMELEHLISSLKHQLETEVQSRKANAEKNQANTDRIIELEKALAKVESPGDPNSELALLRTQVELYFNDLREEKKKRAQEEIKSLDYLAQINALNVRIATLEKALSPSSPTTSSSPSSPASSAHSSAPSSLSPESPSSSSSKIDAQGRKVFTEPSSTGSSSPTSSSPTSFSSGTSRKESTTPVPISPSESSPRATL